MPRSMPLRCLFLFAVLGAFLWPGVGSAKFYRFVDEDGRIHFVDDLSKVPDRFLPELEFYKERYDHLPPQERAARIREDRRLAEAREARQRREAVGVETSPGAEAAATARQGTPAGDGGVGRGVETRVFVAGHQILVPVRLGNGGREIEALLLLDTGASSIVLHREVADRLRLAPVREGVAHLVGGQSIRTESARLSFFSVGPVSDSDTQVLVIDHKGPAVPFDGLLGMNFLRKVTYSVDYENQVIRWQP